MAAPYDFDARAHALLDHVVARFAAAGIAIPERRIVSNGNVTHDCELVAVEIGNLVAGIPGRPNTGPLDAATGWYMAGSVHVIRCLTAVPSGDGNVTAAQINADSKAMLDDLGVIADALIRFRNACLNVVADGVNFPKSGGLGGVRFGFQLQ